MIGAILRAQLLSMRLGRAGSGRGRSLFSLTTALFWYGLWCGVAAAAFRMTAQAEAAEVELLIRAGLFLVLLYWQVMPVLTATMGAGLDLRKLLIFPIPHARLFQVEVMLRVLTGIEMVMVLLGGMGGLIANPQLGGWAAAPRVLMAGFLFGMFNVLLSSGLRSLLERLLSRGRMREAVVLLAIAGMMLPRLMVVTGSRPLWLRRLSEIREDGLPWTAAAHAMLGESALAWLFALCAWAALAGLFGRWQMERSLRYDSVAAQASAPAAAESYRRRWAESFYRFPALLWRDPLAAVVEKELRTLSRAPRFRMVFVMGFSFGLLVWLPLVMGKNPAASGALGENFLVVVSVYAMTLLGQVSYWNSFGFDRSAAQIYFFAPSQPVTVLLGKNLASLVYIYLEAGILVGVTVAFRVKLDLPHLAEMLVVLTVCAMYMLALGNLSSVQYPHALNPERTSTGGATNRLQALIFIVYPLALLPVFLAYVARYVLSSNAAFWVLMTLAAAIGAALYWIAMESATATAVKRREHIVRELSRGEGPVAGG